MTELLDCPGCPYETSAGSPTATTMDGCCPDCGTFLDDLI